MEKPNRHQQKRRRPVTSGVPSSQSVSATEAQNNFGRVLNRAAGEGVVYITRYDRPQAVVVSMEHYQALTRGPRAEREPDLDRMTQEFDQMLARMQGPQAHAAFDALFEAGAEELGEAAVRGARRGRRRA